MPNVADGRGDAQISSLSEDALVRFCAVIFPAQPPFQRFVNEARFGLSRILPALSALGVERPAILEVGAGSCILSAYLASAGLSVTALEPLGPEFDFFADLQRRVLAHCSGNGIVIDVVRAAGEQLDLPGRFDFAFSINALEHMPDPLRTIDNMHDSLRPMASMLVHCPNYSVPFDSHFNALLVTRSKWLNGKLYRSRIARYPQVWEELNFIRYPDVRRHLAARGWDFRFNDGLVRDLMMRLLDDPIFAERMPVLLRMTGRLLQRAGLIRVLQLIPAKLQSPMEFVIKRTT